MHGTHETPGIETVTEMVVIPMIEEMRVILKKMPLKDMIPLKSMSLPVTWGDKRVVNGETKTGSSLLHHRRRHRHLYRKKNVRKLTEGNETGKGNVIEIWTAGTTERGTWIAGIGRNVHKDQIVVIVGLPGILGHPGIRLEMRSLSMIMTIS
jgi:hypothetical protein